MSYRESGSFDPPPGTSLGAVRKRALRALVEKGRVPGLIGYRGRTPIGWISLGPRGEYAKLQRSPIMKPVDEQPVWSVVCFFVHPQHRGAGCQLDAAQVHCDAMLWLKAFHIVFVVTWFAGLFYLPRLFVYHASATDSLSIDRFRTMERRLFAIMTIGALLAGAFGLAMVVRAPAYLELGWFHAKLTLVALLIAYHAWCYRLMQALGAGRSQHSQRWYRWFNEAPGVLLIAIVVLAVVKPALR